MARRLSVVVEEEGLEEARPRRNEVHLKRPPSSWEVPAENNGDIQILSYPKRKPPSTTTRTSAPTAAATPTAENTETVEDLKGDEKDDTVDFFSKNESLSKAPEAGGGGTIGGDDGNSTAERRQQRTTLFARLSSGKKSSYFVPHITLSSRASSSGSSSSIVSSTSASSRMTLRSRQHRSFGKPHASSVVEPGYAFPAGFSMDTRRALEVATLKRFEKLTINPNIGEFWMMIDASWVDRWVDFALANAGPPGPITNRDLYSHVVPAFADDDGVGSSSGTSAFLHAGVNGVGLTDSGLVQGLKIAKDYRALHPLAWYILETLYGTDGAPDICRWKADIYSHPVSVTRRLKAEKETQTKAIHEVSRAVQKLKHKLAAAEVDRSIGGGDGSDAGN